MWIQLMMYGFGCFGLGVGFVLWVLWNRAQAKGERLAAYFEVPGDAAEVRLLPHHEGS